MKEMRIRNEQFNYIDRRPFYVIDLKRSGDNLEILEGRIQHHWHTELEICYCQYSGHKHYIDGKEYISEPGKVFVVNSGSIHHFDMVPYEGDGIENQCILLLVKKEYLTELIPGFSESFFMTDGPTDPALAGMMKELARYAVDDDAHYDRIRQMERVYGVNAAPTAASADGIEEMHYRYLDGKMSLWQALDQQGLVLRILAVLIRDRLVNREEEMPLSLEKNLERLKGVISYVEEHYQEPLTAAEVASRFYFSRSYFSHFFSQNMQLSFKDYLNEFRAKKARLDLLETTKSIYEVALDNGFADRRTFNAALALGAEGVYCGTAFLLSKESRMAENVKEAAVKADARDLLLFRTIPAYYRSLPGELANELVAMDKAGATNEELGKKMGGFANLRIGMLEGDMDKGYVSLGNGISHIHEIKSVKEIVEELTADY